MLWQDGPREGNRGNLEGIKKCRKIAESVDWECEIYKHYNKKNLGCDPSTFLAFKCAFFINTLFWKMNISQVKAILHSIRNS